MVTLDQIAREAGVSPATVANVLKGRNKETWPSAVKRAQEIRAIAERLGYQVNGAAKATATGRFGCVAILLSTQEDVSVLPSAVWKGLHDELEGQDIHITMFHLPDEYLTDPRRVPKILREWMADGLIVDYTHRIPPALIRLIEDNHLPAVWFNTWRTDDCVRPDDLGAAQRLGTHLLELGHRHVTYLDFSHDEDDVSLGGERARDHYSAYDRLHGVHQTLQEGGAKVEVFVGRLRPFEARLEFVLDLLKRTDSTALISQGGDELEPVLLAARDLGLNVPRDVSLVGFGPPEMKIWGRRITSMAVPERELGRQLGLAILQKIEQPAHKFEAQVLPLAFEPGVTCGPAPQLSPRQRLAR